MPDHVMPDRLSVEAGGRSVEVVREDTYSFRSTDNVRRYDEEVVLDGAGTVYGVIVDGRPRWVIGAGGGGTALYEHSALVVDDKMYLAIGQVIVALDLAELRLTWSLEADVATCFGLHYSAAHDAFICHGELAISRFTPEGQLMWQSHGEDIFTGEFSLADDVILAEDWDGRRYRIAYDTGKLV